MDHPQIRFIMIQITIVTIMICTSGKVEVKFIGQQRVLAKEKRPAPGCPDAGLVVVRGESAPVTGCPADSPIHPFTDSPT
jgi:hypothetical protein